MYYLIQSRASLKYLSVETNHKHFKWTWDVEQAQQYFSIVEADSCARNFLKTESPVVLSMIGSEIVGVYEPQSFTINQLSDSKL